MYLRCTRETELIQHHIYLPKKRKLKFGSDTHFKSPKHQIIFISTRGPSIGQKFWPPLRSVCEFRFQENCYHLTIVSLPHPPGPMPLYTASWTAHRLVICQDCLAVSSLTLVTSCAPVSTSLHEVLTPYSILPEILHQKGNSLVAEQQTS